MKIAVKLHGILRDYRPAGVKVDLFEIALSEPAIARHAAEYFGIPPQKVHAAFLNDEPVDLSAPLADGDHLRLFPPVVGGSDRMWRIFIAGIMQGSRRANDIDTQDYRGTIGAWLTAHVPNVEIVDPFELHPNSIAYSDDDARRTLIDLARTAGRADAVVAFVPEASMGTALEMWEAYHQQRIVITISPLIHNWVVKSLSTRVLADLDEFLAFVESGEFERVLAGWPANQP
ncbi:MAG TPA: MoaD/ThiS family protein [Anaerolineae bacterium]|nr:MoaD/ThiS family protein [Anaerolineae bacterium]